MAYINDFTGGTEMIKSTESKNTTANEILSQGSSLPLVSSKDPATGKTLSVSLGELLYSSLKEQAIAKNIPNVIGLAKELREVMKLNFEIMKFKK